MRTTFLVLAVLLAVHLLAAPAAAQAPSSSSPILSNVYGPYSVYGPGLTYTPPSYYYGPYFTGTTGRAGSSYVPGSGSARMGGNDGGIPSKAPTLNRGYSTTGGPRYVRISVAGNTVRAIVVPAVEELGSRQ